MNCLPATNVKALPALNMVLRAKEDGRITRDTHTIVEYSSGSTVISLSLIANIMGIPKVKAYMSNKTSEAKLNLLRFFGLDLTVFGGHGQPEPLDPNGGIYQATVHGQQEGWFNPDQYSNFQNFESHMRWTGPQLLKQLPELKVFAASIGTSGTMTGTGLYLKEKKPSVTRVGVCTAPDDRVPGPRSFSLLAPVEFPWRDSVDGIEEIASFESFEKSLELCRSGLLVGPSSGLALLGLIKYLEREKAEKRLDSLRNEDGEIPCIFICCDQPFQYINDYMAKLGPSYFPEVNNAELLDVDPYPYNIDWEVPPDQAHGMLFDPNWTPPKVVGIAPVKGVATADEELDAKLGINDIVVLDLRDQEAFKSSHIPGSISFPVDSLQDLNPYQDPPTMVRQFRLLDKELSDPNTALGSQLTGKVVLTLSHRGHIGRLAMSILRNRKVKAHCVMGGSEEWKKSGLWGLWKASVS
ncbi:tryptophan synthase beta subunit-like PLP-dependent enzyme, partial [Hymenopellis radicata]